MLYQTTVEYTNESSSDTSPGSKEKERFKSTRDVHRGLKTYLVCISSLSNASAHITGLDERAHRCCNSRYISDTLLIFLTRAWWRKVAHGRKFRVCTTTLRCLRSLGYTGEIHRSGILGELSSCFGLCGRLRQELFEIFKKISRIAEEGRDLRINILYRFRFSLICLQNLEELLVYLRLVLKAILACVSLCKAHSTHHGLNTHLYLVDVTNGMVELNRTTFFSTRLLCSIRPTLCTWRWGQGISGYWMPGSRCNCILQVVNAALLLLMGNRSLLRFE